MRRGSRRGISSGIQPDTPTSLVDVVLLRVQQQPEQHAYTYLSDDDRVTVTLTYHELDVRAREIAVLLQQQEAAGQPVLLCYPPGLDYITAFFGCLYAGAIAVPAYSPDPQRPQRTLPRLQAIARDSQAVIGLTLEEHIAGLRDWLPATSHTEQLRWLPTDNLGASARDSWCAPQIGNHHLALLMYTSGSTRDPRGVMVSHGNVLHNLGAFPGFDHRPCSGIISWLPLFHDLGLLLGVLHPLYRGVPSVLMSPMSFVQHPFRWLQALTRYGASTTGAPNFAYDLCVRKITPEERNTLDLHCWTMALNGAEPVRHETLTRFTETFAPYGFRHSTWYPSYGLAEATATVTGGWAVTEPVVYPVDRQILERHQIQAASSAASALPLIGCGRTLRDGQQIMIVHPDTHRRCGPDEIGEIWIAGPSVALGYWKRPAETAHIFHGYLQDTGAGPFLRSGDLGVLRGDELCIVGRLKDLIIIKGRNLHPHDLELTVERCHPAIHPGGVVAFSITADDEEHLVIVVEIRNSSSLDADMVFSAIRQTMAEQHDVETYAISLVQSGSIPKTSSGKLQRSRCQVAWLGEQLHTVASWRASLPTTDQQREGPSVPVERGTTEVAQWLVHHLAHRLAIEPGLIDIDQSFAHYGLASFEASRLVGELALFLDRSLHPTIVWKYTTIRTLAQHLGADAVLPSQPNMVPIITNPVEPIAIVGIGCRFPGATHPQAFWQLLCAGGSGITETPSERSNNHNYYHPDPTVPGTSTARHGGFLDGLDLFDAHFFGISPREAAHLDPRQRLMLELTWEALEDAGIPPSNLAGTKTGIFVALLTDDYEQLVFDHPASIDAYSGIGTANSLVANRISYFFDFHGPSIALDTACSGSLVALHMACQSLRGGESVVALVGGVSINLLNEHLIFYTKAGILSPDGACKTFDHAANGTVRSEGAGLVVLKPLTRALADGDSIYAVVQGSAVNSDGRSNGIMAPNGQAQETLLWDAYHNAGVVPGQIQYVEAHGTGTKLGDPIEVQALGAVLPAGRAPGQHCAIGSVKSNLGHLEPAAGIAGLIKVALALKHRLLPPSINVHTVNPLLSFDDLPLVVQQSLSPWPTPSDPLIAGVSAFGIGGTNAHVVLKEAPPHPQPAPATIERPYHLLALSAKSEAALREVASRMAETLATDPAINLADVCYSAHTGRAHLSHRVTIVAADDATMSSKLAHLAGGHLDSSARAPAQVMARRRVVFLFTGQGAQYAGMGRVLYATQPTFRAALDHCATLLAPHLDQRLHDLLFAQGGSAMHHGAAECHPTDHSPIAPYVLDQTQYTQPVLFAFEYALTMLWQSWGVTPHAVLGHSLGEYVAACVAGVVSLEDALWLVVQRGKLMQDLCDTGMMMTVFAKPDQIADVLQRYTATVSIAAINGPHEFVIAGVRQDIEAIATHLQERDIAVKALSSTLAFHSPLMEPMLAPFEQRAQQVSYQAPKIAIISNLTGQVLSVGQPFDATYWRDHARSTVQFARGLTTLREQGHTVFIEMGPRPVLVGLAQSAGLRDDEVWVGSLRPGYNDWEHLLTSVGQLYLAGIPIDWEGFDRDYRRLRVGLPTYPWQRERYWHDQIASTSHIRSRREQFTPGIHPLLGEPIELAHVPTQRVWETMVGLQSPAYLHDHRVFGAALMPGAGYLEMALSAAVRMFTAQPIDIINIAFVQALVLSADELRRVQIVLEPTERDRAIFHIYSRTNRVDDNEQLWIRHAHGEIAVRTHPTVPDRVLIESIHERCSYQLSRDKYYQAMQAQGLEYGPSFQAIEALWRGDGEVVARLTAPEIIAWDLSTYQLHPALLDAAFQAVAALQEDSNQAASPLYLPASVARFHVHRQPSAQLWCHIQLRDDRLTSHQHMTDMTLYDDLGDPVAEVQGLCVKQVGGDARTTASDPQEWLYTLEWQPAPPPAAVAPINASESGGWLILADTGGTGAALAALLEAHGESCVLVMPHSAYQFSATERRAALDPAKPAMWQCLLDDVTNTFPTYWRGIVHLWSLDGAEELTLDQLDRAQTTGCRTVLHLIQALTQRQQRPLPRCWLVTRGAQALTAHERVAVAHAPLWGMGRVIAQELAELWGGCIDLDPVDSADTVGLLFQTISQPAVEHQLAFRSGLCYMARLVRATPPPAGQAPIQFRSNATYLITGGLGGLGLHIAHWIVQQGARRLILLGRTSLPPRTTWRHIDPTSPDADRIMAIQQLEALGASVQVASIDVTDQQQLMRFFEIYQHELWPPIGGVIHAAGLVHDQLLSQMSVDAFDAVLRPKLYGAWLLSELCTQIPLDFFICFSSASALLGTPGQANYAAGNAFMDALAHDRRARGLPALSINWGPWAEVGMAARLHLDDHHLGRGVTPLTPVQGLQAMAALLYHNVTQIAVVIADWCRLAQHTPNTVLLEQLSHAPQGAESSEALQSRRDTLHEQLLLADATERCSLVVTHLQQSVARILRLAPSQVDPDHALLAIGMDSLMFIELKSEVETLFRFSISMIDLLQGSNIVQLASQIVEQRYDEQRLAELLTQLEQLSAEEAQLLLKDV